MSHFNEVADVWGAERSATVDRRLAKDVGVAIKTTATWLCIASAELMSRRLAAP
jgi:hypothetical protein